MRPDDVKVLQDLLLERGYSQATAAIIEAALQPGAVVLSRRACEFPWEPEPLTRRFNEPVDPRQRNARMHACSSRERALLDELRQHRQNVILHPACFHERVERYQLPPTTPGMVVERVICVDCRLERAVTRDLVLEALFSPERGFMYHASPADARPDASRPSDREVATAYALRDTLSVPEDAHALGRSPADLAAHEADNLAPEATGTSRELGVAGADGEKGDPVEP